MVGAQVRRRRGPAPGIAALAAALGAAAGPAGAIDFSVGDTGITGALRTQIAVGAAVRTQDRKEALVGKLNLPGQEQFCEDKAPAGSPPGTPAPGINCSTVAGNEAFLALPGYPSVNFDNGNLNYEQGDVVNAALKIAPRLQLTWESWGLDLSGVYFYDPVNLGFDQYHPNNRQDNNGFQPRHTARPDAVEEEVGSALHLLDAFVSGAVPLGEERQLAVKAGNQVLSFGTSTLLVFNSLNVVNPPDANVRFIPGSDVREVFQRIPLLSLGTNFTESLSIETFYAFQWKPIVLPAIGSFYSVNDVVGTGDPYIVALFGKYREDPDNRVGVEERTQGNAGQLSDAGRTLYLEAPHEPQDGGEYGATLNYFAEALNNTSFTLAYLNLHSRFPVVGFVASELGCSHDSTTAAEAAADCDGFRTTANNHSGREVVPIDTVRAFLEYPEDVHALGLSFSTNLGDVAWTGELVYRPNQPLQVDVTDVGFAALQTIFPAQTIPVVVGPTQINIPGRRVAAPDYIETVYRGNANVQPGQNISGYERFKTLAYNTSFLFLKGASDNPFGADQLTSLIEIGAYQVLDMPPVDELQLGAPGVFYHHSAGVDGTGTTAGTNQDRLNPHYQADGYATEFSWGYRWLNQLSYEDVLPGIKLQPQAVLFHDVAGKSPLPSGEFVEGRKQAILGLAGTYQNDWSAALRYTWFFGAGTDNAFSDRDNVALTISYDF